MRQREGEKTKPNEHHTGWVVVPGHEHPTADPAGHAETTDCHHGHPATPRAQTRPMPAGWATCPGERLLVRVPRHGSEDASTMKARATPLVSPRPSSPRALPDRAGVPARCARPKRPRRPFLGCCRGGTVTVVETRCCPGSRTHPGARLDPRLAGLEDHGARGSKRRPGAHRVVRAAGGSACRLQEGDLVASLGLGAVERLVGPVEEIVGTIPRGPAREPGRRG